MLNKNNKLVSSPQAQSLLIDLYNYSNPKSKVVKVKFNPNTLQHPELAIFKKHMEAGKECIKHHSFSSNRGKVFRYRAIFLIFSLLFFGLSLILYQKNMALSHMLFGNLFPTVKSVLCGISFLLAMVSLVVSYSLCIAKEAANQIASKAKRRLARAYAKKRIEHGISGLFAWSWNYSKHNSLKQSYQSAIEKIDDQMDESIHLLRNIRNAKEDAKSKELLFNQAVAEMNQKVKFLIQNFKEQ